MRTAVCIRLMECFISHSADLLQICHCVHNGNGEVMSQQASVCKVIVNLESFHFTEMKGLIVSQDAVFLFLMVTAHTVVHSRMNR